MTNHNYFRGSQQSHIKMMDYKMFKERMDFMLENSKMFFHDYYTSDRSVPYWDYLIFKANVNLPQTKKGFFEPNCEYCDKFK